MAERKRRLHDPSQDTRPIELHLAQLQIMLGETLKLSGEGRFARRRTNPEREPLQLTEEGTRMLHALQREIDRLTTNPEGEYSIPIMDSQEGETGKMIGLEKVSDATDLLILKSPWRYLKHFCFVCHREWIVAVGVTKPMDSYKRPAKCNYDDCRSTVWHDPVKGAAKRLDWLKKDAEDGNGTPQDEEA
jgi:hypothetical protein